LNEYEPRYRNAAEKNAKWSKRDFEIYHKCNTWYRNWLIYRDPVMLLKDYKKISKDPDYKKYCYPEPREKKNARRTAERMMSRK
jgi:flavin-dependent dehydrogenase